MPTVPVEILPGIRIEHSITAETIQPMAILGMELLREQGIQQDQPEPVIVQEGLTGLRSGHRQGQTLTPDSV